MSKSEKPSNTDDSVDSPTAWFAVLERARLTDDYGLAARAQSELTRLGVAVKFSSKQSQRERGEHE